MELIQLWEDDTKATDEQNSPDMIQRKQWLMEYDWIKSREKDLMLDELAISHYFPTR